MSRPQLFRDKCSSCVFRPDNLMQLADGRLADLIASNRATGSMLICHQTILGSHPEIGETMCRGFWDAYADSSNLVRVMVRIAGLNWYVEVDPPEN